MPDGTKPLPEPMLTYHRDQHSPESNFAENAPDIYYWYDLKITNLNLEQHPLGANELAVSSEIDVCQGYDMFPLLEILMRNSLVMLI